MPTMSKMRIEYEDQYVMVIYKPAGVLSQDDESGDVSVVQYASQYLAMSGNLPKGQSPYVGLIHRIDRPVSGLMIVAKDKRSAGLFSRLLQRGRIRKKYQAIVFGLPSNKSARLENYILERQKESSLILENPSPKSKQAILEYEVLSSGIFHDIKDYGGVFSLLSIRLITGRKHQIRAQLSAMGNPIVADSRYFNTNIELRKKMLKCNFLPKGEIALCANYISFPHPLMNGKIIEVQTAIPDYWVKIL
jgi:23S rRNA pseudouridine1911/1915/1917 synthase